MGNVFHIHRENESLDSNSAHASLSHEDRSVSRNAEQGLGIRPTRLPPPAKIPNRLHVILDLTIQHDSPVEILMR